MTGPIERLDLALELLDQVRLELLDLLALAEATPVVIEHTTVVVQQPQPVRVEIPSGCPHCEHCARQLQQIDHRPESLDRAGVRDALAELQPRPRRRRARS